jgi:CHAP domain
MTTPNAVLAVAAKFAKEGYKEGKNNDSVFGTWYGLPNNPWCAMFVSYCFVTAGAGKLVGPAKKGFASCTTGLNWLKKNGTVVPVSTARAGDIVFFNWDGGSVDHVGIVVSNAPSKKVLKSVEGNTSAGPTGSQSNGEGVYYRSRSYNVVAAVVRPKWPPLYTTTVTVDEKPLVITGPVIPNVVSAPLASDATKGVPVKPVKVYIKVLPGDSYWKIAATVLRKKSIFAPIKIARESKRIQVLNGGKALYPGDKVRIY